MNVYMCIYIERGVNVCHLIRNIVTKGLIGETEKHFNLYMVVGDVCDLNT